MEGEQFSLCWNNFNSNLRTGFHTLLKDEDLVDVTLAAEGHFLKAHKAVLSICSPYLKEIFRANPGDHPIVILPDISYSALQSLLEFMYQGEVSVSQDEIPAFMKVAETLKVKGLTENDNGNSVSSPANTNGLSDSNRNSPYVYANSDSKILKNSKSPAKKIQQLRLTESPKTGKSSPAASSSPYQPPNKKHCAKPGGNASDMLMNPKKEPIEEDGDDNDEYDENLDMSQMLDTTISEPGKSSGNWLPDYKGAADTSSPGGLFVLKSRKGHPVLISNGHMYTLNHKEDNRSTWFCVKRNKLNCEGCLVTTNGLLLLSYSGHNHAQLHDVIQRLKAFR